MKKTIFKLLLTVGLLCSSAFAAKWQKISVASGVAPVTNGLVIEYKFDNSNANDTAGSFNAIGSGVAYTSWRFGNAAVFNGSAKVTPPDITTSNIGPIASFSIWFKSSDAKGGVFSSKFFRVMTYQILFFDAKNGTGYYHYFQSGMPLINDGQWHHIVGICDGSYKFYIDNIPYIASTADGPHTVTETAILGALSFSSEYNMSGSIDNVRVYNRALTASEVTSLFNETPY